MALNVYVAKLQVFGIKTLIITVIHILVEIKIIRNLKKKNKPTMYSGENENIFIPFLHVSLLKY